MIMKTQELVSIIVPAYNVETYIEKNIESIINQTYSPKEIIILNDGSVDRTLDKINLLSEKYKDIIVINKKNTGVSDTRNVGIEKARGKYITFFDADDYIDSNFLKDNIELIEKYNLDLVNTGFFSETELCKNKSICKISYKDVLYENQEQIRADLVELFDSSMLYNIWNKIYLKRIIQENHIRFPIIKFGEDVEFNKQYLKYVNRFYNSQKCYYHYVRERKGAVTKEFNEEIFNIRKKEFNDFNKYFNSLNIPKKEYYEYSSRRYIERILGCIENIFCSNYKFNIIYISIKRYINDPVTREALKYVNAKSKKIKIMLIPLRLRMTLVTLLMGKLLHLFKNTYPDIFNKLKNRR